MKPKTLGKGKVDEGWVWSSVQPMTDRSSYTTAPILLLDDDVSRLFAAAVEEESGMPAVAALIATCRFYATLLQPRASELKAASEAVLLKRLELRRDELSAVEEARFGDAALTDVDLQLLAQWLRPAGPLSRIRVLELHAGTGQPKFGLRGVRAVAAVLPELTQLQSVSVDSTLIPPDFLRGTASTFSRGGVHQAQVGTRSAALLGCLAASNPKLKRVKLGDSGSCNLPVLELKPESGCQKLDLSGKFLGAASGAFLGALLAHAPSLVWLDLSHNFAPRYGRGSAWAESIAHGLRGAASLRTLKLRFCALGAEGGAAVAFALRTTRALTLLDLRDNDILTPVDALDSSHKDAVSEAEREASFLVGRGAAVAARLAAMAAGGDDADDADDSDDADDADPAALVDRVKRLRDNPPATSLAVRALISALRVNATLATPLATLKLGGNKLSDVAVARIQATAHPDLKLSA